MTNNQSGARQRGQASAVSPLVRDLLANDSRPLPLALQAVGSVDPASRRVPFSRYFDPKIAELEREHIWRKSWQFAVREEDIPNVGDRVNYDVGTMSFMIVRSAADQIRAFTNSCLHRGTRLADGVGSGPTVRCPFHGWEWKLDGSLNNIPSSWDFPQVEAEQFTLPEIKVGRWGGFIFVNPDTAAGPLEDALGILPSHFDSCKGEDRFTFVHVRKRVRANWKTTMEAFFEAYHVIETHSDSLPFTGDASTQYDIWDDGKSHISRLITPLGIPSPHLGDSASAQAALDAVTQVFAMAMGPDAVVPHIDAAAGRGRAQIADWRRQLMGAGLGRDFSARPDAEFIDTIQYFMFPNFCPWYGEGLPLTYQFLPYGDDPNECVMSVRLTFPVPGGGVPRPPSAPIIELGFDETFGSVPELGLLAHIFDQDMSNLPNVQKGLRGADQQHAYATLGQYQECRISHFHETLDRYLGL